MKTLSCLVLIASFTVFANAQAGAPSARQQDALKAAPAVTVLRAGSYTLHLRSGTRTMKDARVEVLGPQEIRADEIEHFVEGFPDENLRTDDLIILRGAVTLRSNPHVR